MVGICRLRAARPKSKLTLLFAPYRRSMTPEELNRTIEFIIQSQARLAAAQEQDREDRIQFEQQRIQFEQQSRALDQRLASVIEMQVRVLESQTRRLDQHEGRLEECERENRAAQKRHEEFMGEARHKHEEAMARLDRILEKLTDRMN